LFASEGTKVVEIFPFGYSHNCFYTLANYSGCVYYYLQGENINGLNKEAEYGEGNNLDIYVDIEEFKKICRLLFDNNNKL
ncbi:hypothetical protein ACP3WT_26665, partial [Salmonella enterica]|uniref:hypothetical protein n=1 Tax=Salmonella enterica TaxID=28901 RepID=UPI003CF4ADAA